MAEKRVDHGRKGSVFLITSSGETLRLPIPSRSPNDPLQWSNFKRILVLLSMSVFTTIGLVQVQGTSLLLQALQDEYRMKVILCHQSETTADAVGYGSSPTRCFILGTVSVLGNWCLDLGASVHCHRSKTCLPNVFTTPHLININGCDVPKLLYAPHSKMSPRNRRIYLS